MKAPAEFPSEPPRPPPGAKLLASFAVALPVFLLDLARPGDVDVAVLYAVAVLLALGVRGRDPVVVVAVVCTLLSVIGGLLPWPDAGEWPVVLRNRSIGMLAIWGTALAGLRVRDMALAVNEGEAQLRESEARFRSIFNTVRDPVFVYGISPDGQAEEILEANEAACRTYGYTRQEFCGLKISQLVSAPGVVERVPELVRQARTEGSVLVESEHRTKDGRRIPVDVRVQLTEHGGREAILAVARDISERKTVEETIRESERREKARADELETLMEAVPALVFIAHDPEGRCITGNRAACEMLRLPPGSNLSQAAPESGARFRSYSDGRRLRPTELPVQRASRGEELLGYEELVRFDDGTKIHLYGNAIPLHDKHGNVRGALAAAVDVTERKRAEEQLKRLADELEQRVESRTAQLVDSDRALAQRTRQLQQLTSQLTQAEQRERRKLSRILHDDIQQILTGVKIQLGTLERAEPGAHSQTVRRLSDYLNEAIQSARMLSHELSPQILYDGGLADALRWLSAHEKEKYDLELHVDADPAAEPASEDVKVLLFQAVRELLLNVVKHAAAKDAWVSLQAGESASELCVAVSDPGAGFDPVDAQARSDRGGHLGLFAIRERLEVIGGRMTVDSAPGQGARICLYAPVGRPPDTEPDQR